MLASLALKNIKERKFRTLLASLSITIGTASLIVFLGLSSGIQRATFSEIEKKSPLTQISVTPNLGKTGVISLLNRSEKGQLTEDTINQISAIAGVKTIYPEIQYNSFSSLEIPIFGMTFSTETMVFGVPKDFIKNDLQNPAVWDKTVEPYPVLIPRQLLDLYNLTIASPQNLPQLNEAGLIGREITYYPNYSTFFPSSNNKTDAIKLEVVGFSDKINLIGVTLPDNIVQKLNEKYTGENSTSPKNYLELFVETMDATQTTDVAKKIESLGLNTAYFQKNLQDVDAKFAYLKMSLGAISLIIFLTAAIAIISTFLATIAERTKEIGLFRALGATKNHIRELILIEAGITGLIGSGLGIIVGLISSKIIDNISLAQLTETTFHPATIFNISPTLILGSLIFGTLLSILAGLIPAQKAANISPMVALNRL